MPDAKDVGDRVRLEDAVGEEGFVVLKPQKGQEPGPAAAKEQAGGQGGQTEFENSGEPVHLEIARIRRSAMFPKSFRSCPKRKFSIWPI